MYLEDNIQFFNTIVKIDDSLFKNTLITSVNFAHTLMADRGQSIDYYTKNRNASKPIDDTIVGKIGELFVAYFLTEYLNYPFILPDFTIYKSRQKDWSEDLRYSPINKDLLDFHVKTCNSFTKNYCGISWTFQKSNKNTKGGIDSIYNSVKNDIVFFVYMESYNKNEALISFSAPFKKIQPMLKPPKKKELFGLKECIYLNDIMSNY